MSSQRTLKRTTSDNKFDLEMRKDEPLSNSTPRNERSGSKPEPAKLPPKPDAPKPSIANNVNMRSIRIAHTDVNDSDRDALGSSTTKFLDGSDDNDSDTSTKAPTGTTVVHLKVLDILGFHSLRRFTHMGFSSGLG